MLKKKNKNTIVEQKEQLFEFDKFMDEIVQKETTKLVELNESVEDTPQMKYKKRYSDLPQNKTLIK